MSFLVELRTPTCPTCGESKHLWEWDGMTYNLTPMFELFWPLLAAVRSEGLKLKADDLYLPVLNTFINMGMDPEKYEAMNPENGWGDFKGAKEFVEQLKEACEKWPEAVVLVRG